MSSRRAKPKKLQEIRKSPTGIVGLDQITGGGLPQGRPTLVCGSAGCGKTMLAMEFLVRGAMEFNEPGVFMSFEETGEELSENVASMGFDLQKLCSRKKLFMDFVRLEPSEIEQSGAFDLEGLFIRLGAAIDAVGAKRVVLDTLEALFSCFNDDNLAPLRTPPLISLAQGEGSYRRYYRRDRQRDPDSPRHRGICRGLRDLSRSQSQGPIVDSPASHS